MVDLHRERLALRETVHGVACSAPLLPHPGPEHQPAPCSTHRALCECEATPTKPAGELAASTQRGLAGGHRGRSCSNIPRRCRRRQTFSRTGPQPRRVQTSPSTGFCTFRGCTGGGAQTHTLAAHKMKNATLMQTTRSECRQSHRWQSMHSRLKQHGQLRIALPLFGGGAASVGPAAAGC
eukprot:SAG11_NODE_1598_length_4610_cov_2.897362_5_plen_180_part_00